MRQVLSTDMLPAPQRFAFWRDLVSEMTMPIDVRSEHADNFTATGMRTVLRTVRATSTTRFSRSAPVTPTWVARK